MPFFLKNLKLSFVLYISINKRDDVLDCTVFLMQLCLELDKIVHDFGETLEAFASLAK